MTVLLSSSPLPHPVPAPPANSDASAGWERLLVMVMNPHGAQIGLIASLLHNAAKCWAPTARMAAAANVSSRSPVAYYLGYFHCLKPRHSPRKAIDFRPWLADHNTKKGA